MIIRRKLAETLPDAFSPDLAKSLTNMGAILGERSASPPTVRYRASTPLPTLSSCCAATRRRLLCSNAQEVLLPLTLLDSIR